MRGLTVVDLGRGDAVMGCCDLRLWVVSTLGLACFDGRDVPSSLFLYDLTGR